MKLAFDIIDRVNDGTEINIATNGSILNKRVQEVIKNKNISINLSLDALTKELFEKIRINSNFDTIMKNFYEFKKYCDVRVIVCPMTINWHEMINFVDFCNFGGLWRLGGIPYARRTRSPGSSAWVDTWSVNPTCSGRPLAQGYLLAYKTPKTKIKI